VLVVPIALPSVLFNQALISHMKKRALYINNIVPQIMRVILLVVLVSLYGIWGIIIGTILYYLIGMVILVGTFYSITETV
jgi:O-antigen/teichoic acid export membrane protein